MKLIPLVYNFYDEHVLVDKDDVIVNEPEYIYWVKHELPLDSSTYDNLINIHRDDALYEAAIKTLEDYVDFMVKVVISLLSFYFMLL